MYTFGGAVIEKIEENVRHVAYRSDADNRDYSEFNHDKSASDTC